MQTPTQIALTEYLLKTGSKLSPQQATDLALEDWMRANAPPPGPRPHDGSRGYLWKCLFLPDGTELRLSCQDQTHHARVEGDAIVYQGRSVSPRAFTIAAAGNGRNAWRDLLLRLPGERNWKRANVMRRAILGNSKPPESPAAAIAVAAASMSDALKTALALVDHANAQSIRKYERRTDGRRRKDDILADACQFD